MTTLVKMTQDGRRVEVDGIAIMLDGRLESLEVTHIITHPRKVQIQRSAPDATHVAGRIALTREEAERALTALAHNQEQLASDPRYAAARLRASMHAWEWQQGIE